MMYLYKIFNLFVKKIQYKKQSSLIAHFKIFQIYYYKNVNRKIYFLRSQFTANLQKCFHYKYGSIIKSFIICITTNCIKF